MALSGDGIYEKNCTIRFLIIVLAILLFKGCYNPWKAERYEHPETN